ncbi:MAG TPA: hypothetical protein VFY41_02825 [Nitrososphaeraceae archaeon]|nr:hypothetical protein [Nitrososphaeraceae archaeon]
MLLEGIGLVFAMLGLDKPFLNDIARERPSHSTMVVNMILSGIHLFHSSVTFSLRTT